MIEQMLVINVHRVNQVVSRPYVQSPF